MSPEEPGFAPIEDLDPEPPERAARTRRVELALGLVLLLAVVLLGGGAWWDQQRLMDAYRAGARAAAVRDWDSAARAYGEAVGYADAARQASAAATRRDGRNAAYAAVQNAFTRNDAAAALAPLALLRDLGPDYGDTAALQAWATGRAPAMALYGAVALRPDAQPPGLYRYGAAGWTPLAGSDGATAIRAYCPDGGFIYDGPPPPGARPAPPADPDRPYLADLAGRRLLVVGADGAPRATLALDPSQHDWYQCTAEGVWGFSFERDQRQPLILSRPPWLFTAAHQRFGAATDDRPPLPGPRWYVLAVSPDGRRLALADTSAGEGALWQSRVYVADLAGGPPRLLDDRPGMPVTAEFTSDGASLLIAIEQVAVDGPGASRAVLLLDTGAARPPRLLARAPDDTDAPPWFNRLVVGVIHHGATGEQALVTWAAAGAQHLRLFNLTHAEAAPVVVDIPGGVGDLRVLSRERPGAALVVGFEDPAGADRPDSASLVVVAPDDRANVTRLTPGAGRDLWWAWTRAGRLVYAERGAQTGAGIAVTVTSRPLAAPAGPPAAATEIFSGTLSAGAHALVPWRAGSDLFAYITPAGELRARPYDGSADVRLDSGPQGFILEQADTDP
jgi:hypothetical protein